MRAATSASATEPLRLQTLPSPILEPNELRVRVRSIGVNPVDWKMREGGPLRLAWRFLGPPGTLVVGVDFAGEVSEVGPLVTGLKVGQRIVGSTDFSRGQRGTYADEVVARETQCAVLPDTLGFDEAACLPVPGATAWRGFVEYGRIDKKKDARVLVLGASGGVGLTALQLGHALGAKCFGVCSKRNVEVVEAQHATAIDYTAGDALEAAREHGPFDVVLNAVGSDSYPAEKCLGLLKDDGYLGLIVVLPSDVPKLLFSPRRVKSVFGRPTRERLEPLVAMMARGELRPLIEARYPLAQAEQAHVRSKGGKVVGKLLLVP